MTDDDQQIVLQHVPLKEFFKEGIIHQDSISVTRVMLMTRVEIEEMFPSSPKGKD